MRSRDGTQTTCVVCVPKAESLIVVEPPVETPIEEILSQDDETVHVPKFKLSQRQQLDLERRQNYPIVITNSLLKTLNYSLKPNQSIEVFSDILESALKPLKSFSLNQNGQSIHTIASIEDKIVEKIKVNFGDTKNIISYFNSVDRLIKLYNEFKQLTK